MTKRGEIGYVEPNASQVELASPEPIHSLPERHPADRDVPAPPATSTAPSISPPPSIQKSTGILGIKKASYAGLRNSTLLVFIAQALLLPATIAAWALSVQRLSKGNFSKTSTAIFIHVAFAIAVLTQMIFIERTVFRLRGQRYSFLHPGAILPSSRRRTRFSTESQIDIGFAPWTRPPLPSYAAALTQSGHGTGDVEDHLIAVPPPPAYGNTRGSTMLLAGLLSPTQLAHRPISEHSQRSIPVDRPLSYQTVDERWEEVADAERAARLEQTLTSLESPSQR